MKIIGITGGIGSGKSMVTDLLKEKGYGVIDADEVSREAAMPGEPAMLRLREDLGDEVLNEDGSLNRQELAKIIFSDPVALISVNEIFHGDIKERMEAHMRTYEEKGDQVVFISAPLLYEADADWMTDEVWLVTADEEIRIRRVMERDGISEEDVRARMDNQMPEEEKRERADIVIENNESLEKLYSNVEKLI